jgi:UDP-N-acetylmuramyl pentapeptide synthase
VLGEMLELGREAGTLHRGIGRFAAEQGIDAVLAYAALHASWSMKP